MQNYVHLHCQRSLDKCFENSSWTHYDVTVHYVGTHSILTFFAFFKFLSLFHLAVLGSVSSSFVAVSLIGIMSYHHCPWSLSSSYMPSNSAASSLARSVDNAIVAVLLTVALDSLFFMVVCLLVFSLVEFMGSAVVELAVLELRSIVEILCPSFHFHHHYQQFKKGEHLSTKAANILLTHLPLILLSLLSLVLYPFSSCKSTKERCHYVTQQVGLVKNPLGILTTSPSTFCHESFKKPTIFPIILSSLYDGFITSVNSPFVTFVIWVFLLVWTIYQQFILLIKFCSLLGFNASMQINKCG